MKSGEKAITPERDNLSRSVLLNQLVLGGGILVVLTFVLIVNPQALTHPASFSGITVLLVSSMLAIAVPWSHCSKTAVATVPLLDILAIALMRIGMPDISAGLFLIFPIIWLATHFGRPGALIGPLLSIGVIWSTLNPAVILQSGSDVARTMILPIIYVFVAVVTYQSSSRSNARRTLLGRQSHLLEEALTAARHRQSVLREVMDAVDFAVIGFDPGGEVAFTNRAQKQIPLTPGGSSTDAAAFEEDGTTPLTSDNRPFIRAVGGEEFDNVIMWLVEDGHSPRAFACSARQLDRRGNAGGVLVTREVTDEITAIRARDELVTSVSHELKTPLTSIIGYIDLALDDPTLSESTRNMLGISAKNSARLLELIADIMAASSKSTGALQLRMVSCNVAELAEQSVESYEAMATSFDVSLHCDIPGPVTMIADPLRIRQVIDNLVSNAIKYNKAGGHVMVTVEKHHRTGKITVSDTGIGVTAQEINELFTRFFRSESVRDSTVHGTGLGLGISRDIARMHGGDLTISSTPGQGTTATVEIPLDENHDTTTDAEDTE